jgi:hypothetical protein
MGGTWSYTSRADGEILTAAKYNGNFTEARDGSAPAYIDDYSQDTAQMRATTDPYPGAAASLATTLAGEVERIRYLIAQITGETYWYIDPDSNIAALTLLSCTPGFIYGLTLSNNVADATNDIDVAGGKAADSTNAVAMALASSMTKRLDATWVAGTGNGGRSSSVSLSNTTYHVFLIRVGGNDDVGFDTSPTGANLISDHSATHVRRIGSILRESAAIVAFVQTGDEFRRKSFATVVQNTNPGTGALTLTFAVPIGIVVEALFDATIRLYNDGSLQGGVLYTALDETDEAAGLIDGPGSLTFGPTGNSTYTSTSGKMRIRTNTSGQIRARLAYSGVNTVVSEYLRGWIDTRGRLV